MFWYKGIVTADFRGVVGKQGGEGQAILLYRPNSSVLRFHIYDGTGYQTLDSTVNVFDGVMRHIAITFAKPNGLMYLNGALHRTNAEMSRTPLSGASYKWGIGPYAANPTNNGFVYNLKIYSRVLLLAEIARARNRERLITGV
jgi:hypothetical protein